jgi:hypothetical protein
MQSTKALVYSLDSSNQVTCCIAGGAAGCLVLPSDVSPVTVEAMRGAHLFAPVPVMLGPPLTFDKRLGFACSAVRLC